MKSVIRCFVAALAALLAVSFWPGLSPARAGTIELSAGVSYSQEDYGMGNYEWTRRWGASAGYYFFALSELELAYSDTYDRLVLGPQDTTFHDQVLSLNWTQSLTPKDFPIQPYLKIGVGQLWREASGTYSTGALVSPAMGSVTAILGAGIRIYIFKTFALRFEGTTYLVGGVLSTFQQNFSVNSGVSLYL